MLSSMKFLGRLLWSFGTTTFSLLRWVLNVLHHPRLLVDSINIIRYRGAFIFKDLTDRALAGRKGYSEASLFGLQNFMVVTAEKYVKEAAMYGEYNENHPDTYDPQARKVLDIFKSIIGIDTYVNWHGPQADIPKERGIIKGHISPHESSPANIIKVSMEVFEELANNWSDQVSIERLIGVACMKILGEVFYGMPRDTLTPQCFDLLKEADHCMLNFDTIPKNRIEKVQKALAQLNKDYVREHGEKLLGSDNYMRYLVNHEKYKDRTLEDWNPIASLVAVGNFGSTLTAIILQLAKDQALQRRLREKLAKIEWRGSSKEMLFEELNKIELLEGIYKEGLRYYAAAPGIAHYASKPGKIGDIPVAAGTYIFVPMRRLCHDSTLWREPEKFNPDREFPAKLGQWPFIPLSIGNRSCAAQFIFVHKVIKIGLAIIFSKYNLALTPGAELEVIPPEAKAPRFKQRYFCIAKELAPGVQPPILTAYKQLPPPSARPKVFSQPEEQLTDEKTSRLAFNH